MSKLQEWVDNASDQTIAKVFDTQDAKRALAVWSVLSAAGDTDRVVAIHKIAGVSSNLVRLLPGHQHSDYFRHESMVPKCAKAEFNYPTSGLSVGDLVNGVSLCLEVEDSFFPLCLKDNKLSHELNFEITQHQWVPTALQAYKSDHYDFDKKDVKDLCYHTKHATGSACELQWGIL